MEWYWLVWIHRGNNNIYDWYKSRFQQPDTKAFVPYPHTPLAQTLVSNPPILPYKTLVPSRQYYHTKFLSQAANTPLPNNIPQNESQNYSVLILRLSHPICGGNANDKISFFVSRLQGWYSWLISFRDN